MYWVVKKYLTYYLTYYYSQQLFCTLYQFMGLKHSFKPVSNLNCYGCWRVFQKPENSIWQKENKNELYLKDFHEETCFEEKVAKLRVD